MARIWNCFLNAFIFIIQASHTSFVWIWICLRLPGLLEWSHCFWILSIIQHASTHTACIIHCIIHYFSIHITHSPYPRLQPINQLQPPHLQPPLSHLSINWITNKTMKTFTSFTTAAAIVATSINIGVVHAGTDKTLAPTPGVTRPGQPPITPFPTEGGVPIPVSYKK